MNYQLYNADCFEILKSMPDKSVDHVITDPPYGERTHKGARGGNNHKATLHIDNSLIDFDFITYKQFIIFCKEAIRVSRRWIIFTSEIDYIRAKQNKYLKPYFIRVGAWIKPNGMPQITGDRPAQGWEAVMIFHQQCKKRWNGGGLPATWIINKPNINEQGKHPAQKPLALLKTWVEQFTDPGETILDPFMGSGTTGVAAVEMGRKFIGCEIDPKYFKTAEKRIATADNQNKLFEVHS